ncbi:MAG: M3 family metallopeptidase [Flavobacteriaceae bacterium]|nr:M3 family metallopeptidase [Flavobacteriaceae bacterium]
MNPLLQIFKTKHQTAPFSIVKNEHFKPAFIQAIASAKEEIAQIISNNEVSTFKNTIETLEFSGETLNRISSIFFNLNAAETNEEIQKIAQEVSPLLSDFRNDIRLNKSLFNKIKSVYDKKETLNLSTEQETLLDKSYKNFSRNGANLNKKQKDKLRAIDKKIAKLKLQFGENILAESNAYQLLITEESQLKGLPESVKEAAKILAKNNHKKGWLITLDYPSYIPFMTYADNRNLRKKLAKAFGARAFQNNKFDNQKIVLDIVKQRYLRANLLGYKTHADFILEERMAENPKIVKTFLTNLLKKAKPAAEKEFEKLSDFAAKDGVKKLEKWDASYYTEKLKKELFNLDEEALKPYFKLENVLNGVFTIANKLYDLNFKEVTTIDKYHKEVKTYEVTDYFGNFIAVFYTDFFPRKGKRNGAWMTSYKSQFKKEKGNSRPHISIVCNFTKPTKTTPSLLTFNEVRTLFHEFGHALHGMLANTNYPSLSGTNVFWDFVELPSQIFENWAFEKEALDLFAKHYKTNEIIPIELVTKIKKAANFMEGMSTLRQLSFAMLDMHWHGENPENYNNVKAIEIESFTKTQLYPNVKENCMSTAFSHIFQGGYSAGYYSYKWAEVLDADAFEHFKENGIFDKKTAHKFKDIILSKGGTEKPMVLYKRFRGKEPNVDALLDRAGLI